MVNERGNRKLNEIFNTVLMTKTLLILYNCMGFRSGITREKWIRLFEEQDIAGMIDCLHKIKVYLGDVFIVKQAKISLKSKK